MSDNICSCGGPLPCPQRAAIERASASAHYGVEANGGPTEGRKARWLDALTLPVGNRTMEQHRVETVSRAIALADIEGAALWERLKRARLEAERLKAERDQECAHTALSLIYLRERDEARAEVERLTAEVERVKNLVCDREDIIIERDATIERVKDACDRRSRLLDETLNGRNEARAAIRRVRAVMDDVPGRHGWITVFKVRAALDAPTESAELAACQDRHPAGKYLPTFMNEVPNLDASWDATCGHCVGIQAAFDRRAE